MNKKLFSEKISTNFPFSFTKEQEKVINKLSDYILSISTRNIFLLKGYAGTGKTTLISALVKSLSSVNKKPSLAKIARELQKDMRKLAKWHASSFFFTRRSLFQLNSDTK